MSLLASVFPKRYSKAWELLPDEARNLTEIESTAKPERCYRSTWEILKHVADVKAMYMVQTYGEPKIRLPEAGNSLESVLAYLDGCHALVVERLVSQTVDSLQQPVPTTFHGESGVHLFAVLAQHDIFHGAPIEVLRG